MSNDFQKNSFTGPLSGKLEKIVPPDVEWVGSCRYLLCFTSLFMYLEHDLEYYSDPATLEAFGRQRPLSGPNVMMQNRERIYKVFLAATGMGLINHWTDNIEPTYYAEYPQNYEVTKDYIARSMNFAGYRYKVVDQIDPETVMAAVKDRIDAKIPVLAYYHDGWELVIGYDIEKQILLILKENEKEIIEKENFTDQLASIVCVMETGCEKTDVETVIANVIETMETKEKGLGMQGYYEAIDFFSNDELFNTADDETLQKITNPQIWGYFASHAESRGFAGMGFGWFLLNRAPEFMRKILRRISEYCDQHHQISWCGNNALDTHQDLRNPILRQKVVYAIYCLIENDMLICRLLKQLLDTESPDVLVPYDRKKKKILHTQVTDISRTAEEIEKELTIKSTDEIDLERDMEVHGEITSSIIDGALQFYSKNDFSSMAVKKYYSVPFKADIRVKTSKKNIHIYYGKGRVTVAQWKPNELRIVDPLLDLDLGYPGPDIEADQYLDITWILHKTFTALLINGKVYHYGVNYPYMNLGFDLSHQLCIGTVSGTVLTIEKITVSELES